MKSQRREGVRRASVGAGFSGGRRAVGRAAVGRSAVGRPFGAAAAGGGRSGGGVVPSASCGRAAAVRWFGGKGLTAACWVWRQRDAIRPSERLATWAAAVGRVLGVFWSGLDRGAVGRLSAVWSGLAGGAVGGLVDCWSIRRRASGLPCRAGGGVRAAA